MTCIVVSSCQAIFQHPVSLIIWLCLAAVTSAQDVPGNKRFFRVDEDPDDDDDDVTIEVVDEWEIVEDDESMAPWVTGVIVVCGLILVYIVYVMWSSHQRREVRGPSLEDQRAARLARLGGGGGSGDGGGGGSGSGSGTGTSSPSSSSSGHLHVNSDAGDSVLRQRVGASAPQTTTRPQTLSASGDGIPEAKPEPVRAKTPLEAAEQRMAVTQQGNQGSSRESTRENTSLTHGSRPSPTRIASEEEPITAKTVSETKVVPPSPSPASPTKSPKGADAAKLGRGKAAASAVTRPEVGTPEWEKYMVETFTKIFAVDFVQDSGRARLGPVSVKVKSSEWPREVDKIEAKSSKIFTRLITSLVWQHEMKMRSHVACWNSCQEALSWLRDDDITIGIIKYFMEQIPVHILDQLRVPEELDMDDIYSDIVGAAVNPCETEVLMFLAMIAGWDMKGVNLYPELLQQLLQKAQTDEEYSQRVVSMVHGFGLTLTGLARIDMMKMPVYQNAIAGLKDLLTHPAMLDILAVQLEKEVKEGSDSLGLYFEKSSVFGPLLSITTIPPSLQEAIDLKREQAKPWTELDGFPKVNVKQLRDLEMQIVSSIHQVRLAIYQSLRKLLNSSHSEIVLEWLGRVISLNEFRREMQARVQRKTGNTELEVACSDGFMLNFCAIMLEFCVEFCMAGHEAKLKRISPAYPSSTKCRINYDFEMCLAGGIIAHEKKADELVVDELGQDMEEEESEEASSGDREDAPPDVTSQTLDVQSFNKITEMFHVTLRAMNVGFFVSLKHFQKLMEIKQQSAMMNEEKNKSKQVKPDLLIFALQWECHLIEANNITKGCLFYDALATWLRMMLKSCEEGQPDIAEVRKSQRCLFASLPEFIIKDMAEWFRFTALQAIRVHPSSIANIGMTSFVDCCIELLERPDLMPGPIPAARIVQALQGFVHRPEDEKTGRHHWGMGAMPDTTAIVYAAPKTEAYLGPALIHKYTMVGYVEGLNVDKEDFNKYGARAQIGALLMKLWERFNCRQSILDIADSKGFRTFLSSLLDTLVHELNDSLYRVSNAIGLEQARSTWSTLSIKEQVEKEHYLKNETRAAKGFMAGAVQTLDVLLCFTSSEVVCRILAVDPLASRTSAALHSFLNQLLGPKAQPLKELERFCTAPKILIKNIIKTILRIVEVEHKDSSFVLSLAINPDCDIENLEQILEVMRDEDIIDEMLAQEFEQLLKQISVVRENRKALEVSASEEEGQDWQAEADAITVDMPELEKAYQACLKPLQYEQADLLEYHSFHSNASQSKDVSRQQTMRIFKEMREWQTQLPCHPDAAIVVRQDEMRNDVLRVMITGVPGTPYSLGCFFFDFYFPATYPRVPPLVKLITTGGGNVRFNPNMYADGSVCLSLLGTFTSADSSQTWQANKSRLLDVLLSLQTLVMNADPIFNEPGYARNANTPEGDAQTAEYNAERRMYTVRHAMLEQIRTPPRGFERVVHEHFRILHEVLLKQLSDWLKRCHDEKQEQSMRRDVNELREELNHLVAEGPTTAPESEKPDSSGEESD